MSAKYYRQGDVLFVKISDDPNHNIKGIKDAVDTSKELIFARGEAAGAKHKAATNWLPKVKAYTTEDVNQMILRAFEGGDVVHEKPHVENHVGHQPMALDKGTYVVVKQYETFQGVSRRVID